MPPEKYFLRVGAQGLQHCGGPNWKQISVGNVKSFPRGTSFEGVKGSEGTAEVWQWESPEEVTGQTVGTFSCLLIDGGEPSSPLVVPLLGEAPG